MITKIATHTEPEFFLFTSTEEEESYWLEICPCCNNRDCNDDCVFIVPGSHECPECYGKGRIRFMVRRNYPDAYFVITACGNCEGIGLV